MRQPEVAHQIADRGALASASSKTTRRRPDDSLVRVPLMVRAVSHLIAFY